MTPYKVWAIVLSYNHVELTLECLQTIRNQSCPDLHLLVVDNASTDGTAETLRAACADVTVLSLPTNLGYAGGNNVGIRHALAHGADAVFLLNNDTRLAPDCVENLVHAIARNPEVGAAGPMIYTWDNWETISSAGGSIRWQQADAINEGAGETDIGQYPAREVDFLNGCALMVTRTAIVRAGMLDERYFMYWEETDWCRRIRDAGMTLWFEPSARVQHKAPIHHQEMSALPLYYMGRNRVLFFGSHTPWPRKPLAIGRAGRGLLHGVANNTRLGKHDVASAAAAAVRDAALRRWGPRTAAVPNSAVDHELDSRAADGKL
jgi:hypothetical protein